MRICRLVHSVSAPALFLAGLLAGCAAGPTRPVANGPLPVDVEFDRSLSGLVFASETVDPDPHIGNQLRYASQTHPDLVTDIFVFVGGIHPDHESAGRRMVMDFRQSMDDAIEHGLYKAATLVSDIVVEATTPYGKLPGRHVRMFLDKNDDAWVSHAYLFYLPPYTVKFRATFPDYGNRSYDDEINRLVDSFMGSLRLSGHIACRKTVNIHETSQGTTARVSIDGLDIISPANASDEEKGRALVDSLMRMSRNYCRFHQDQTPHNPK